MKYYLIAGEASGDLHASHLMTSLRAIDAEADFRFYGGDMMAAVGGTLVRHYRGLAYMGFIPVLLHLPTILSNMRKAKRDIAAWQPDVVILVDYPGFNMPVAKYVRRRLSIPVFYYISPTIWAWKEYRIKSIKRDVDEMFSILPFEKPFYERRHGYAIHYVGNPTADEVRCFRAEYKETADDFRAKNGIAADKPLLALLAGSRTQEIKDNLPMMISVAEQYADRYTMVVAGAPSVDDDYYSRFLAGHDVRLVRGQTYPLLAHAEVALVTSGTATLETALFDVPQVVCYKTPLPRLMRWAFDHIMKVKYISLVNLIAEREVVDELFADRFSFENISSSLSQLMPGGERRRQMLDDYDMLRERLGKECAHDNAARIMHSLLEERLKKDE